MSTIQLFFEHCGSSYPLNLVFVHPTLPCCIASKILQIFLSSFYQKFLVKMFLSNNKPLVPTTTNDYPTRAPMPALL